MGKDNIHVLNADTIRLTGCAERLTQHASILACQIIDLVGVDLSHHCSEGVLTGSLEDLVEIACGDVIHEPVGIADREGDQRLDG